MRMGKRRSIACAKREGNARAWASRRGEGRQGAPRHAARKGARARIPRRLRVSKRRWNETFSGGKPRKQRFEEKSGARGELKAVGGVMVGMDGEDECQPEEQAARGVIAWLAEEDDRTAEGTVQPMLVATRLMSAANRDPSVRVALSCLGEAQACQLYRDTRRRLARLALAESLASARDVPVAEMTPAERACGGGWGVLEMLGRHPERRLELESEIPRLVSEAHAFAERLRAKVMAMPND